MTPVPRSRQRRGNLGRVVRIVVEYLDTAGLAATLEPASRAGELGQHRLSVAARNVQALERGERTGGVSPVVLAAKRQRSVVRRERFAPNDLGHVCEPALEQLLHLRPRAEGRVM